MGFGNVENTDFVVTKSVNVTSQTVSLPSTASGDLIVLVAFSTFGAITKPAAYTSGTTGTLSGDPSAMVCYKVSSGSESNPAITIGSACDVVTYALKITNPAATPLNVISALIEGAPGGNFNAPAVTTTAANCIVFTMCGARNNDAGATWPPEDPTATGYPSGMTAVALRETASANTNPVWQAMAFATQASAGATPTMTWTGSPATAADGKTTLTFAIALTTGGAPGNASGAGLTDTDSAPTATATSVTPASGAGITDSDSAPTGSASSNVFPGLTFILKDTDSGVPYANLTGIKISIRLNSDDAAVQWKSSSCSTNGLGVCAIENSTTGTVGAMPAIGTNVVMTVDTGSNVESYFMTIVNLGS